ncbi:MAG TPA: hypothetical protein VGD55_14380, partial [Acidothermaceae bacterium]
GLHGEIARLPWTVTAVDDVSITARVNTVSPSWQVKRTVAMTDVGFTLHTEAVNTSEASLLCSYGEHPCFARDVFAGGRIDLAASAAFVPTPQEDPVRAKFLPTGAIAWPRLATRDGSWSDADRIPEVADGRLDHVSLTLAAPRISLYAPRLDGHLDLVVQLQELPHALLWERFGRSAKQWNADVFAVEPSSAPGRTVDDAVSAGALRSVAPGQSVTFGTEVEWSR